MATGWVVVTRGGRPIPFLIDPFTLNDWALNALSVVEASPARLVSTDGPLYAVVGIQTRSVRDRRPKLVLRAQTPPR